MKARGPEALRFDFDAFDAEDDDAGAEDDDGAEDDGAEDDDAEDDDAEDDDARDESGAELGRVASPPAVAHQPSPPLRPVADGPGDGVLAVPAASVPMTGRDAVTRQMPPGLELDDARPPGPDEHSARGGALLSGQRPAQRPARRTPASSDSALTIAQFYNRVRAALAQALPGEVWVVGEIRSVHERKGHRYLELADHGAPGPGSPGQQLQVVCWSRDWQRIRAELARAGVNLEEGRVVRVRGRVNVWEGGGKLSLTMTALDVEALLGGIAFARQRLLHQLAVEGLVEANRLLALSPVPLRIGLVTSEGSEGHRDFAGRLERTVFAFELVVERSLVQGPQAPWQIAAALRRLSRAELDLAVIVRGGGGRGDLAAFDSEQVARAIATAPFPVWIGVGHSGDRSVADEVAHGSFITPTACGEAIVARVEGYWSTVSKAAATLAARASSRLETAAERVDRARSVLSGTTRHQLLRRVDELATRRARLAGASFRIVEAEAGQLGLLADRLARCGRGAALEEAHGVRRCRDVLRAYDPQRQLERGWSLTRDEAGRVVRSLGQVSHGQLVFTAVADGELAARVEHVTAGEVQQ